LTEKKRCWNTGTNLFVSDSIKKRRKKKEEKEVGVARKKKKKKIIIKRKERKPENQLRKFCKFNQSLLTKEDQSL